MTQARLPESPLEKPVSLPIDLAICRAVFNGFLKPVSLSDESGHFSYFNQAWYEFTGLDHEDACGVGWLAAIHPEDRDCCKAAFHKARTQQQRFEIEYRLRQANGEYHWIIHDAMPLFNADKRFAGYLGICLDISKQKQAELAARNREAEIRLLADSLPVLIAYAEAAEQRYTFANTAYASAYGWDEQSILGHTVREVIGEENYRTVLPYVDKMLSGQAVNYQRSLVTPDGSSRFIEGNLIPHFGDDGRVVGAFILLSDITKHRLAEQAVRDSEERLKKFAAASIDGVLFHENGIVTDCNEAVARLLGFGFADIIGHHVLEFLAPETHDVSKQRMRTGSERLFEGVVVAKGGQQIPVEVTPKQMPYQGHTYRMAVIRDITERKEAEQRIQFMAHHDNLTLLPNRVSLMERLQLMLATARREQTLVAVMFIDLDHFKTVNDSLGHHAGDSLLKVIAGRLKTCLRDADTVARLGGDEFLVVVPDLREHEAVVPVVTKILEDISQPCSIEGHMLSISPSIGISMFPRDGADPDDLIKNADAAMYLAKDHGRANYQFFTPRLNDLAFEALSLESHLRDAIKHNEFLLHYQPQMNIASGDIVGIEALIRWRHPLLGLLPPEKFITVAEQRGLIFSIGAWALEEACRQNKAWQRAGLPAIPIGVNLSAVQFKRRDLVADLAHVLERTGLDAQYLELEVTESVLMEDVTTLIGTLLALKDLGVKIAIDDFGTGYSSLSYLKRFPIDKIKIDRSFVHDLPHDADDLAITGAIIGIAKSLKIKVIAEGVENHAQLAFLRQRECDEIQGFYLSPAVPAEDLVRLLQKRRGIVA